jgi:cytochrome c biogenesis protein CcmG/thiol:disulfide interchange protein DsbE
MRTPVILGFLVALLAGIVAIAVIVAGIADAPPVVPTLQPFATPIALTTPSPTPSAVPTPTPTSPGPTASSSGGPVPSIGTAIGQQAPDFVLPFIAGGEISTADSRGKPLWVNFMATWCPQCQDELPMMMSMTLDVGDAMDIIVVDVSEDPQTVSDFLVSLGVDLPVALDADGAVQREWAANALPVHFWLDGNGIVQEIVYGGAPRDVFEAAIKKVVPDAKFSEP